jgi:hypothetical protein
MKHYTDEEKIAIVEQMLPAIQELAAQEFIDGADDAAHELRDCVSKLKVYKNRLEQYLPKPSRK